jgi:hypothetical protein
MVPCIKPMHRIRARSTSKRSVRVSGADTVAQSSCILVGVRGMCAASCEVNSSVGSLRMRGLIARACMLGRRPLARTHDMLSRSAAAATIFCTSSARSARVVTWPCTSAHITRRRVRIIVGLGGCRGGVFVRTSTSPTTVSGCPRVHVRNCRRTRTQVTSRTETLACCARSLDACATVVARVKWPTIALCFFTLVSQD